MALENVLVPENVSVPPSVASVPVVGKVTLVDAVVVSVREYAPLVVKASAKEIVLELGMVKVPVEVVMVRLLMDVAVAAPIAGVVKVGEVARTKSPEPVSSVMELANTADVAEEVKALLESVNTTLEAVRSLKVKSPVKEVVPVTDRVFEIVVGP